MTTCALLDKVYREWAMCLILAHVVEVRLKQHSKAYFIVAPAHDMPLPLYLYEPNVHTYSIRVWLLVFTHSMVNTCDVDVSSGI